MLERVRLLTALVDDITIKQALWNITLRAVNYKLFSTTLDVRRVKVFLEQVEKYLEEQKTQTNEYYIPQFHFDIFSALQQLDKEQENYSLPKIIAFVKNAFYEIWKNGYEIGDRKLLHEMGLAALEKSKGDISDFLHLENMLDYLNQYNGDSIHVPESMLGLVGLLCRQDEIEIRKEETQLVSEKEILSRLIREIENLEEEYKKIKKKPLSGNDKKPLEQLLSCVEQCSRENIHNNKTKAFFKTVWETIEILFPVSLLFANVRLPTLTKIVSRKILSDVAFKKFYEICKNEKILNRYNKAGVQITKNPS